MKSILVALALIASTASADMMRAVTTDNLKCQATSGRTSLKMLISAGRGVTKISFTKGKSKVKEILNREDLVVGSEGVVYIQQVSNELGYNLSLAGEGLQEVLRGQVPQEVALSGQIELFNDNKTYQLKCEGTLY